jgi:dihydrofolate synthase/folylpolyglutamate synthase
VSARAFLLSLEQIGIKLGLEQIRALLGALNRPDRSYPSVLIGGTNGKGSVAAMVERALRAAGCRTGRYTSPHLVHLEERFAIDGAPIRADTLEDAAALIETASRRLPAPPSFFEATTALALELFRREGVDIAVLEVGLGGRLDATNAVDAMAVAITAIDFDHEAWLGDTLEAIAREKAGLVKPGAFTVLADNPPAVDAVIDAACRTAGVPLLRAADVERRDVQLVDGHVRLTLRTPAAVYEALTLGLAGRHQVPNAATAVRLLEALSVRGIVHVPAEAIRAGLEAVVWPGRLERLQAPGIDLLIDGAHNPAGARALAAFLEEVHGRPLPMVLGVMADKRVDDILTALAPAASHVVCTAPQTPRALRPEALAAALRRVAPACSVACEEPPHEAVRSASRHGAPVVVAGSLYLAGEVRAAFAG